MQEQGEGVRKLSLWRKLRDPVIVSLMVLFIGLIFFMLSCYDPKKDPEFQWLSLHDRQTKDLNDRLKVIEHRVDSLITNTKPKGVRK